MLNKFPKKIFLIALISFLILLPQKAEAAIFIPIIWGLLATGAGAAVINWAFPSALTDSFASGMIALIDTIVNYVFGLAIVLFINLIKAAIGLQNLILKIEAVEQIWGIFRDFANLFFILLLIITAFATIFNRPHAYTAKELLPKIIIAALLINFSLVIFHWTVDLLWTPATVFLRAIGGETFDPNLIGDKLGGIFYVNQIQTRTFAQQASEEAATKGGGFVFTVFKGVLFIAIGLALGWIAFVLIVRIPVLLGLAVISPIAWISLAFPSIREKVWGTWWKQIITWGLIPFYYLAIIYFVIFFNKEIQSFLMEAPLKGDATGFWPLAFNTTILMFTNVGLLLYGLYWVHQYATKSGALGYNLISAIPYVGQVPGGLGKVWGKVQQGGVPGLKIKGWQPIAGKAAREKREAELANILGKSLGFGSTRVAEKIKIEEAEKANKDIEDKFKIARSIDEMKDIITGLREKVEKGAKDSETLAAINALAKKGELDFALFNKAVDNFKDMPLVLNKIMSEWKEGKFGGLTKAEDLLTILKNDHLGREAKALGYAFVASKDGGRVAEKMTLDDFTKGYQILGKNTKEGREFKKSAGKSNPSLIAMYNWDHRTDEFEPDKIPEDIADAYFKQIEGASTKDIADYNKNVWEDPYFRAGFTKLIIEKKRQIPGSERKFKQELAKRYIREGKGKQLKALNEISPVSMKEVGMGEPPEETESEETT